MAKRSNGSKTVKGQMEPETSNPDAKAEAGAATPPKDPWVLANEIVERRERKRRESEEERRMFENHHLSVVFGDSTVTILDGLDQPIARLPGHHLNSDTRMQDWRHVLADEMARRNCTRVGCRMSQDLHVTILTEFRRYQRAREENFEPRKPFRIQAEKEFS